MSGARSTLDRAEIYRDAGPHCAVGATDAESSGPAVAASSPRSEQPQGADDLPGMLAVAKGVAEQRWPHTMDAQVWAREFMARFGGQTVGQGPDEGDMIGWFANAIMAGYDTANARAASATALPTDQIETARALLRRVLNIGLDEGASGAGPAASASEKRAGALAGEIATFLRSADSTAKDHGA